MTARQDAIRQEFAELDEAQGRTPRPPRRSSRRRSPTPATRRRRSARRPASRAPQIIAETREQAQAEAARIVEHGHAQIAAERQQAVTSLRAEVGTLATDARRPHRRREPRGRRAQQPRGRPVPRRPRDPGDRQGRRPDERGRLMLRGASAEALADLSEQLGSTRTLADAATLGEELFGVARVLRDEPALRRVADRQLGRGRGQGRARRAASSARRSATALGRGAQGGRAATLDVLRATWPTCSSSSASSRSSTRRARTAAGSSDELFAVAPAGRREPGAAHRAVRPRPVGPRTSSGLLAQAARRQDAPGHDACWSSRRCPARTRHRRRVAARLPGHRGRRPRRDGRHRAHRARAAPTPSEQRLARRSRQAVRHARSTSTSWSTPTSSAGCGSRSATTSSTAPSPAASTTPDAGSPADRRPPRQLTDHEIQGRGREHDGAFDSSGGDPRRAPEVRRGLQALGRQQGRGRHTSPRPVTASRVSAACPRPWPTSCSSSRTAPGASR